MSDHPFKGRPLPQWYDDCKFGIFIHWGVYSVPGWSTKGNYAEWYQQGLQTTDSARKKFHQKNLSAHSAPVVAHFPQPVARSDISLNP